MGMNYGIKYKLDNQVVWSIDSHPEAMGKNSVKCLQ